MKAQSQMRFNKSQYKKVYYIFKYINELNLEGIDLEDISSIQNKLDDIKPIYKHNPKASPVLNLTWNEYRLIKKIIIDYKNSLNYSNVSPQEEFNEFYKKYTDEEITHE